MNEVLFLLEIIGAWVLTVFVMLPVVIISYFLVTYIMECQCGSCQGMRRKDHED